MTSGPIDAPADGRNRLLAGILILGVTLCGTACRQNEQEPLVVLFGIDGASPEVIEDLRHQGKLPAFDRLIRSGAFGQMKSLSIKPALSDELLYNTLSPTLWTSIATGKVPEKHGILDFVLPVAGTESVWMGTYEGPPRAELVLPEITGRGPFTLHLRLHSHSAEGEQSVQLLLNEQPLDLLRVPVTWADYESVLAEDSLRPVRNHLTFIFSRQSGPASRGHSEDERPLAGELEALRITDREGTIVYDLDPVQKRSTLGRGFYKPPT